MQTLVIDDQDTQARRDVQLQQGEKLVVELEEHGTTGYEWHATAEPAEVVAVTSSEFVPPASSAAGAAGRRRIVVTGSRPGTAELELELRRPWEAGRPPRMAQTVAISVRN